METRSFHLEPIATPCFGDPMYRQGIRIDRTIQPAMERERGFRDSVKASGFEARYSGKGTRSDFIESIRLD